MHDSTAIFAPSSFTSAQTQQTTAGVVIIGEGPEEDRPHRRQRRDHDERAAIHRSGGTAVALEEKLLIFASATSARLSRCGFFKFLRLHVDHSLKKRQAALDV